MLDDAETMSEDEPQYVNLFQQAQVLLERDQVDQAIDLYKQCLLENQSFWRAHQNLGIAFIIKKDYWQALTHLLLYTQKMPDDELGYDSLGVVFSEINLNQRAIACFFESLKRNPTFYLSYYNLGVTFNKVGNIESAKIAYTTCLHFNSYYPNAYNNLGDIYRREGKLAEALLQFHKAIEVNPQYVIAIKNLGNTYFQIRNYQESSKFFISYLQHGCSIDEQIARRIGIMCLQRKHLSAAIQYLRISTRLATEDLSQFQNHFILGLVGVEIAKLTFLDICKIFKRPLYARYQQLKKQKNNLKQVFEESCRNFQKAHSFNKNDTSIRNIAINQRNWLTYNLYLGNVQLMIKWVQKLPKDTQEIYDLDFYNCAKKIQKINKLKRYFEKIRMVKIQEKYKRNKLYRQRLKNVSIKTKRIQIVPRFPQRNIKYRIVKKKNYLKSMKQVKRSLIGHANIKILSLQTP